MSSPAEQIDSAAPSLDAIVAWLDQYLRIAETPDESGAVNGLQVANSGRINRVVAAVDASFQSIERVVSETPPGTLMLVHHGLFWDGNLPLTGRRYRRIRALLNHDVALYSAHIPLDLHPEVGNNALLAQELGILDPKPFDQYRGVPFGAAGQLRLSRAALVTRLSKVVGGPVHLIAGGPERVERVGVITGAAGSRILAAAAAGLDTFITGEGAHHTAFDALESGINVCYAGHYATETFGVRALAQRLGQCFHLPWAFHDHPTGL